VTVVTGFLGAGKTTLVNGWLSRVPRGEVAVIVNELGTQGIDAQLLAARADTLIEVSGGCVCCTTQAELVAALNQLAVGSQRPRRILIETSGAASPAGVLRAIRACSARSELALNGVVTVVDATRLGATVEHELASEQLGFADVVVLSRADLCSAEELHTAEDALAQCNGAALVVRAEQGELVAPAPSQLSELVQLASKQLPAPRRLRAQAARHVYESLSFTSDVELDGERFAAFMESELARFAGRLFRVKGILAIADLDARMIVQGVADSVEITFGEPWADQPRHSRLVVIGFGLERDALTAAWQWVTGCSGEP
jgi:G3E family GTPase